MALTAPTVEYYWKSWGDIKHGLGAKIPRIQKEKCGGKIPNQIPNFIFIHKRLVENQIF